jgi:hypothetical protein
VWFKKAADQGYNRAKINLGFLYEQGLGVPQDQAMALNLYREGSGIQDELLYASEVEVEFKKKDEQISGLQGQVQAAQADSADLRAQVEQLKAQLAERRRALETSQRELSATQDKLAQAKASQDTGLSKLLENEMLAQEQKINTQRSQIASLESRAGGGGGGAIAASAGSLQILDPIFVATRGRSTAMVRAAGKSKLVGKVSNPAAIASISVNGQPAKLEANGTFSTDVDVAAGGTAVKVAAVDKSGGRAQLDFTMVPQAGGGAGAQPALAPAGSLPRDVKLGRYYAVVIGNNTYNDSGYAALKSAASDATAVANVLRDRYGYQTNVLLNASRLEMLSALNDMREKLGANDNLLIYYAGHGEMDAAGKGYWVPSDGVAGNSKTWVSNAQISDMLNAMPAKHVLTVVDSCYSGTMTSASSPSFDPGSMSADKWNTWVKTMANGRSRTALTSGGLQPVPDVGAGNHSYFARAFINALQDNGKLLEAGRLYRTVSTQVALTSVKAPLPQNPRYAPIRFAGHESGEFFFLPKGAGGATGR